MKVKPQAPIYILLLIILPILSSNLQAIMYLNGIDKMDKRYSDLFKDINIQNKDNDRQLTSLTVKGAAHFIRSYSLFKIVLSRIESYAASEKSKKLEQQESKDIIKELNRAESFFVKFKYKLRGDYKSELINKLKKFEYGNFRDKHRHVAPIFEKARTMLKKGNPALIVEKIINDCKDIREEFERIEQNADNNALSRVISYWRLNQKFANSMLFGQYIAEVLCEIENKKA